LFAVKRTSLYALVVFLAGLTAGVVFNQIATASVDRPGGCRLDARSMARLELLFGTARVGGASVSEADWAAFLDAEVTPRFPNGLTVLSGPGQWRGQSGGISRERAMMLVIWYAPSAQSDAAIEAIRAAYRLRFDQESVMRIDGVSCVSF
jgi:hypothetical protein